MHQQTQQSSNNVQAPIYNSTPTPIYSSSQRSSTGQPSRAFYNDYENEREDIKPREKHMPLATIDKKLLLLDDGRLLNLTAHDPQKWPIVIEVWS